MLKIPFYKPSIGEEEINEVVDTLKSGWLTTGPKTKQFEQELRNLGYTGFTVDEKYDSYTAAAVKKWQKKLGLTQTGTVELGRVVYAPGEVRVATQKVASGDAAQPGQAVLSTTGTARVVTVKLSVSDQRLAVKDASVTVNLPDGKRVDGTITAVATVIDTSGKDPATKIEVTIALASAVEGFTDAAVDVNFTAAQRKDVLTVPVAALLALAEGGYGVQVVDGDSTRIVAVQTGLFSGGRVEVSGSGITARLAMDQGREVWAVPGNITSPMSWGPNLLIKSGGAKLVQEWTDVADELPAAVRRDLVARAYQTAQLAAGESLPEAPESNQEEPLKRLARRLLNHLQVDVPTQLDALLETFEGVSSSELISALFDLEMSGLARQLPGKNFVKVW